MPSVEAAAETVGVSPRTLFRWLADARFREQCRAASRRVLDSTVGRLRCASSQALSTLQKLLTDDSAHVRYLSASKILDVAVRVEVDEVERRIEALEEANAPGVH